MYTVLTKKSTSFPSHPLSFSLFIAVSHHHQYQNMTIFLSPVYSPPTWYNMPIINKRIFFPVDLPRSSIFLSPLSTSPVSSEILPKNMLHTSNVINNNNSNILRSCHVIPVRMFFLRKNTMSIITAIKIASCCFCCYIIAATGIWPDTFTNIKNATLFHFSAKTICLYLHHIILYSHMEVVLYPEKKMYYSPFFCFYCSFCVCT